VKALILLFLTLPLLVFAGPPTSVTWGVDGSGHPCNFSLVSNTCISSGGGSVTSVGLADGSSIPIYSISNSPVTSSGNLTFSLLSQIQGTVLAGPTSGASAQPTFRRLISSDLPPPPNAHVAVFTTGTYTFVTGTDQYVFSNSNGATSVTLPDISSIDGVVAYFKNLNTGVMTINPFSGVQFIDNNSAFALNAQYQSIQIVSQGGNWWVF
jgi:hypothetical protein